MHSLFLLADMAQSALLLFLEAIVKEVVVNASDQMGSFSHRSDWGCLPCTGLWITGETSAGLSTNQRAADVWTLPVNLYLAFRTVRSAVIEDNRV